MGHTQIGFLYGFKFNFTNMHPCIFHTGTFFQDIIYSNWLDFPTTGGKCSDCFDLSAIPLVCMEFWLQFSLSQTIQPGWYESSNSFSLFDSCILIDFECAQFFISHDSHLIWVDKTCYVSQLSSFSPGFRS